MLHMAIVWLSLATLWFTGICGEDLLGQFALKNRVLLIFAKSDNQNEAGQQLEAFRKFELEAEERQLIIGVINLDGGQVGKISINKTEALALFNRYGVEANSFAVVLIGKDSGVKLKQLSPVPAQDIFDLIDSMPMRRSEIGTKH